jgi:ABC-type phosphate transport system ATPase subunit
MKETPMNTDAFLQTMTAAIASAVVNELQTNEMLFSNLVGAIVEHPSFGDSVREVIFAGIEGNKFATKSEVEDIVEEALKDWDGELGERVTEHVKDNLRDMLRAL